MLTRVWDRGVGSGADEQDGQDDLRAVEQGKGKENKKKCGR
jgi:hypothetical protein